MSARATTRRVRQAAAARPKVVAGYVRLTVDRDGNKIGIPKQKEAIQRWADAFGYSVVWFEDRDITAAKLNVIRPAYEEMLSRVEAGEFVGVVVWRLDRLVRLTREFERCFGIIEDAKAFVMDVEQQIKSNTDTGKIMMRILVMMAEMEISAMRARARAHQQWKAERGMLSAGGFRPFGFVGVERDDKTGAITNADKALIAHVPEEAELIKKAAHRILHGGATYQDIVTEWATASPPITGTNGKPFTVDGLYQTLIRPRIAGLREYEVEDEETEEIRVEYAKAVWEPILDRDTWDGLRARRRLRGPVTSQNEYLLNGGLIKCGVCRQPMVCTTTPAYKTGERVGNYRCNTTMTARAAGSCGKPIVQARFAEDVTLDLLFERIAATPELLDVVGAAETASDEEIRKEAAEELNLCREALRSIGTRKALRPDHPDYLDPDEAAGERAGYLNRKQEAERTLARLRKKTGVPAPNDEERQDVRSWFDNLKIGEKRNWLRAHLTDVFVAPRTSGSNTYNPDRIDPRFADAEQSA